MVCDTCKMNRLCAELERMEKVPRHEKCRCFSQSRHIRNADIIRVMTDEELADFIAKQRLCTLNAIADIFGIDLTPALFPGCKKNMLDWLKQDVERSELPDAESEIDKWWERSETVNAERSEDGKDKI